MTTKNKIAQVTIKIQDETIKALLKDIKFYDKLLNNVFNWCDKNPFIYNDVTGKNKYKEKPCPTKKQ